MDKTQKITITISNLDLGKIDLLVDNLVYSSRSDFIRDAIRNHLKEFEPNIQEIVSSGNTLQEKDVAKLGGVGAINLTKSDLEYLQDKHMQADIMVVGILYVGKDITLEQVSGTIRKVKVYGKIIGSGKAKTFLEGKSREK